MSDLQDRISRLSPDQRALLERMLRRERAPEPASTIQPRPDPTAEVPASFGQQRLWFLDQMEPGRNTYNVFDSIPLDEPIDVAAVDRSLNEIVRRHEALRTTFGQRDHAPVQVVAPSLTIRVAVHDVGRMAPEARDDATARLTRAFADEPFDLARGPLLRAAVLRSGDDVAVLLVSMHHIVTDAWSLEVFQREFQAVYAAFRAGRPSPLASLPIQFGDYAVWQRTWLTDEVRATELAHWTQTLHGAPQVLDLPIAGPRPARPSYRGESQLRPLGAAMLPPLRALAQAERSTMFMTTLAAFYVLLMRYTGHADLMVGTPVACRDRRETGPLIGFFVNTVVLRTDLGGDPTFREVLQRTRDACLAAFAHQDLPFEMVVEAVQPDRDPSRNPLFQITFQYAADSAADDDAAEPDDAADDGGAAIEVQPAPAKFDLAINIWDGGRRLRVQADYSTDLFEAAAVARLLLHLERVLDAAVRQPDVPVSRLPLLSDRERHQAIALWNATTTAYPRDASLAQLFAMRVAGAPAAIAVVDGDGELTYAELDRRAAALALALRAQGVAPGDLVGVHMPRSAAVVVAQLGIIRAGAAYVPLDPEYPAERLAFMAADAALRVVVTDGRRELAFGDGCIAVAVPGEDGPPSAAAEVADAVTAESAAYVIYTSGSTGRPKGVVVTHRAVVRTVCETNYLTLTAADRVAQASTVSFDAATFEIWGALLNGATLVVTPSDLLLEPERLAERVRALGLTVLFVTTAVLNQAAARAPRAFAGLRCLLFGGEAVDAGAVRRVLRDGPPQQLVHVYGPTESTTFATFHRVTVVPDDAVTVPIGAPLANTSAYVLDGAMQPVPVGVAGELYIGGDGLARGYLHDAALTEERFVPHPFAARPGDRLYRSGDLAKYRADGAIEFLGRRDGQVKIRGFRIELGEVEALLREHPDVDDAVAVCREDAERPKRLVAYVVARPGRTPAAAELRAHLSRVAPAYMVPSTIVLLQALPLTANGKVNRVALPVPEELQPPPRPGHGTRTPTEAAVSRIFADVLGLDAVGLEVNFFERGGHSLLATQVVSRVRETLQVELPLRAVFTSQTAAALAAVIDERRAQSGPTPGPSIARVPRDAYLVQRTADGQLALSDPQKRRLYLGGA